MFHKVTCYKIYADQFQGHLWFHFLYKMSSLCDRCKLGRFQALSLDEGNRSTIYGTKCLHSTGFSISVRRCSVAIYCTGCTCYLKPTVLQDQIPLDHIQWGRYLYSCCRENTNSHDLVLEADHQYVVLRFSLWVYDGKCYVF